MKPYSLSEWHTSETRDTSLILFLILFQSLISIISTSDRTKGQTVKHLVAQSKENKDAKKILVLLSFTTEKDPIPDASGIRKGKTSTNSFH